VFRFNHAPDYDQVVDHSMQTYALNYVREGRIYFGIRHENRVELKAPALFWTWPGPWWQYGAMPGSRWDHAFISWKGERTQRFIKTNLFPMPKSGRSFLHLSDPLGFEGEFFALLSLLKEREPDDPRVVNRLEGLLLLLHQQPPRPPALRGVAARIHQLMDAVDAAPEADWDFAAEAERLGCSPAYLRRVWKARHGCSPVETLQRKRMNLAALLLRQNELSVDQVLREVGYEHAGYFYRLFREHYGMAPGQYAREFQTPG